MSGIKASNPKDAVGSKKVGLSRVSMPVLFELDAAMFEGAMKYGRHNYRAIGVRYSVYFDATMRHLAAWWEGQDIDPDSGLHHVTKAIAGLMVVRDAMLQGKVEDDRPPVAANQRFVQDLNDVVATLLEKYPTPVEPWTQVRVDEERWEGAAPVPDDPMYDPNDIRPLQHLEGKEVREVGKLAALAVGYCTGTDRRVGPYDRRVRQEQEQGRQFMRRSPVKHMVKDSPAPAYFVRRWGRRVTDPLAD